MAGLDLNQLVKLFTRRGERVVVVLPEGDSVVLLPLVEYEKLVAPRSGRPVPEQPQRRSNDKQPQAKPAPAAARPQGTLEQVDPPQGGMKDDDQYYPEPLEG